MLLKHRSNSESSSVIVSSPCRLQHSLHLINRPAHVSNHPLLESDQRTSLEERRGRERERGRWLKMMLPGIEVARKRRIHNHEIQPWGPHGNNSQPRDRLYSSMAEPALAARIRLEERLRGVASATPPNPSSRSVLSRIFFEFV
jgi:hypothetical protein